MRLRLGRLDRLCRSGMWVTVSDILLNVCLMLEGNNGGESYVLFICNWILLGNAVCNTDMSLC